MYRTINTALAQFQKKPLLAWGFAVLWVLLITGIVAWLQLGGVGLIDETEPLFAEAARQMTVTGDWITPYFNGETRFDKPPLVYWLMAIAYKTVGVNEWSVRFPSALAITGLMAIGFYTLYRFGFPRPLNPQTLDNINPEGRIAIRPYPTLVWSALIGSAAIALNPQTFLWARTGVSDMLLNGCMGIALLAFFCGYAQLDRPKLQSRWYLTFYIFSALAVLTKGPVGIVLPGLILIAFSLYMGNLRVLLREMRLIRGGLVFLLITLPWYILVTVFNGQDYIDSFFGYHNVERFTSVVNNHSAPWYFYFLVVPIAFLPWSAHLPVAMARLRFWRVQDWRQQPRSRQLGLFALIWFAVIFGFFTIAVTKLPSYTIPLLPAAGILVGLFWSDQLTQPRTSKAAWISHGVNILLFVVLVVATWYSPNWLGDDPEMPNLADRIRQSNVMISSAIVWGIAAIGGLILLLRRQGNWLWSVNLIGLAAFILVGLLPAGIVVDAERHLPLRQLSETIVEIQQPNEPIVMVGFSKPSIVFYTQRPVIFLPEISQVQRDLRRIADRPDTADSILILGRDVKLREAELPEDSYQPIAQQSVYQLVRMPSEVAQTLGDGGSTSGSTSGSTLIDWQNS
ncbi:ArnT family glycosyltransferase [Egbenema bharatensis]|uniref:ArnT family glycosyltransferase n=1 Tax=Egbenema bharatensis TaxID=3463334 RepID=UPI003A83F94A